MSKHPLGQRQTGRHQKCGPIDRMKAYDILTDDVHIRRPEARKFAGRVGIANSRHIGRQGVDPDIHHMIRRSWYFDTPVKTGARHAQIPQAALYKAKDLIPAAFGLNKIRILRIKFEQRILIAGQAEKPCFFDRPFYRRTLRRQFDVPFPVDQFAFVVKGFVPDGIPAFIAVKIQVSPLLHGGPQSLARLMMALFAGTHECCIRNIKFVAHISEIRRHFISKLECFPSGCTRCLHHFKPMLVGTRDEAHIASLQTLKPRNRVGCDSLIGVADMRLAIRVRDGRGNIKGLRHGYS